MSKTFNKNIQYTFNPQITLPTSSGLSITGNSNTVGNIFTTGGNVGIGTMSPSTRLEVIGPNFTYLNTRASAVSEIRGARTSNTPETILRLGTGHYPTVNWASSAEFQLYNYSGVNQAANSGLNIRLGAGGSDNPDTSIMTLLANGNVGIGTTTPSNQLHIVTNSDNSLGMGLNNDHTGGNSRINFNMNVGFASSGNAGQIYASVGDPTFTMRSYSGNTSGISLLTGGAAPIKLITNNSERIRIATDGNVGIGTASPSSILHLSTSSDTILNMTCSTGGHNTFIFNSPSTSRYADLYFSPNETINFRQRSGGSYPSRLFINTSGNVGIGTTSPATKLQINSDDVALTLRTTSTGYNSTYPKTGIQFRTNLPANYILGEIFAQDQSLGNDGYNADLIFRPGIHADSTTERMRIKGINGNVGIGTSSPQTTLSVNGTTLIHDGNLGTPSTNTYGSNGTRLVLWPGGGSSTPYALGINSGSLWYGVPTGANHVWFLNTSEVMRINTSGRVGIGEASPTFPLHVNGSTTWNIFSSGAQIIWNSIGTGYTGTPAIGVYSNTSFGAQIGFYTWSDNRIKKNIQDVTDSSALDILRLIEPKTYKYVDIVERGNDQVYGFIAQQIESILPSAVSTQTDFIPDVYAKASVSVDASGNTVLQVLIDTEDKSPYYDLSKWTVNTKIKLYDMSFKEHICTVISIDVQNNTIVIQEPILDSVEVFIIGCEVNDVKVVNKDAIWTVATAALQEVDRQLQEEKEAHKETQSRLQAIETLCEKLSHFIQEKFPDELTI